MSLEIVTTYANHLADAIKSKNFAPLIEAFAEKFEMKATLMGKTYEIFDKEKLTKFLGNMPGGLAVDINKILSNDDGSYTAKTAMGMGFMKMPVKWNIKLDDLNKISFLEIK